MKEGCRVKLNSWNGTQTSPSQCNPREDYWRLIGMEGIVLRDPFTCCKYTGFNNERSVLVRFDISVESLGLGCHNDADNSLWIPVSDLLEVS